MSGANGRLRPALLWVVGWLVVKDLTIEYRSRASWPTMLLFALLVMFVFTLAIPPGAPSPPAFAAGVLWLGVLLAAVIGANQLFAHEERGGAGDALRFAPLDPAALYLGKVLALLCALTGLELIILPAWVVLYGVPVLGFTPFLLLIALATLGIAGLGVVLAAMAHSAPAREFLLPLLLLPLAAPLLANLVLATPRLLAGEPALALAPVWWLVAGYDIAVLAVSAVLYEFLLEGD
jgi:heme exporter protein B